MKKTICILGGGIVGISVAMYANKHGFSVTLLEADRGVDLGGETDLSRYYNIASTRTSILSGGSYIWGGEFQAIFQR